MYNLTFDNPYNREIVKKLKDFRNKQQGYYIPTFIEPEHMTHQYDPITITGGSFASSASLKPQHISHYPADLFEPKYTTNRNLMVGNRLKGGSSDYFTEPFYSPVHYNSGTSFDRKDKSINDLGAIHSKRRAEKTLIVKEKKKETKEGGRIKQGPNDEKIESLPKDVLETFKRMSGGEKPKSKSKSKAKSNEGTSKLLRVFN